MPPRPTPPSRLVSRSTRGSLSRSISARSVVASAHVSRARPCAGRALLGSGSSGPAWPVASKTDYLADFARVAGYGFSGGALAPVINNTAEVTNDAEFGLPDAENLLLLSSAPTRAVNGYRVLEQPQDAQPLSTAAHKVPYGRGDDGVPPEWVICLSFDALNDAETYTLLDYAGGVTTVHYDEPFAWWCADNNRHEWAVAYLDFEGLLDADADYFLLLTGEPVTTGLHTVSVRATGEAGFGGPLLTVDGVALSFVDAIKYGTQLPLGHAPDLTGTQPWVRYTDGGEGNYYYSGWGGDVGGWGGYFPGFESLPSSPFWVGFTAACRNLTPADRVAIKAFALARYSPVATDATGLSPYLPDKAGELPADFAAADLFDGALWLDFWEASHGGLSVGPDPTIWTGINGIVLSTGASGQSPAALALHAAVTGSGRDAMYFPGKPDRANLSTRQAQAAAHEWWGNSGTIYIAGRVLSDNTNGERWPLTYGADFDGGHGYELNVQWVDDTTKFVVGSTPPTADDAYGVISSVLFHDQWFVIALAFDLDADERIEVVNGTLLRSGALSSAHPTNTDAPFNLGFGRGDADDGNGMLVGDGPEMEIAAIGFRAGRDAQADVEKIVAALAELEGITF